MAGRKPRGRETAWDMILSMAAVTATVGVIMLLAWRPQQEVVQSVDYPAAVENAKLSAIWPISIPSELPEGYRATSARFEPESYGDQGEVRWLVGFQTQAGEYISIWQSDGPARKVIATATNNADCEGTELITNNKSAVASIWQKCEIAKPLTRSFVQTNGAVTTVVAGTVQWAELLEFAQSLEQVSP